VVAWLFRTRLTPGRLISEVLASQWLAAESLESITLSKRNRKKPSVSMSQRSSPPLLDRSCSTTMNITAFPPEVFEMVVGEMSFVDLPYFVQCSKTINVPLSVMSKLTRSACSKELDMGQE
jgi:hypothetical protein